MTKHLTPRNLLRLGAFLLIAGFLGWWRYVWREQSDDALITFRYALNFARGLGMVYNPGERVLGTSTPLFALVLGVGEAVGLRAWITAQVIDCVAVFCTCVGIVAVGRRVGHEPWGWFAVGLFLLYPLYAMSIGGMETGFFTALVYGAWVAIVYRRFAAAAALAALACMARMEGFLFLPVLVASVLVQHRREALPWKRYAVIIALPVVAYVVLLTWYYGSPLPQSMLAKLDQATQGTRLALKDRMVGVFARELFVYFGQPTYAWGAFECIAVVVAFRTLPALRPLLAWCGLYLLFMLVGRAPNQYWYHQPLYPARCVCVTWCAYLLARRGIKLLRAVLEQITPGKFGQLSAATIPLATLLLLLPGYTRFSIMAQVLMNVRNLDRDAWEYASYVDAARIVNQRARDGDELAAPEIGYLGYVARVPIFDVVGLVTPTVFTPEYRRLDWYQSTAKRGCRFMVTRIPDYRFHPMAKEFASQYRVLRSWLKGDGQVTVLFERRIEPSDCLAKTGAEVGLFPRVALAEYVTKRPSGREFQPACVSGN